MTFDAVKNLWQEVIETALWDVVGKVMEYGGEKLWVRDKEAMAWFLSPSGEMGSFRWICLNADILSPVVILDFVSQLTVDMAESLLKCHGNILSRENTKLVTLLNRPNFEIDMVRRLRPFPPPQTPIPTHNEIYSGQ